VRISEEIFISFKADYSHALKQYYSLFLKQGLKPADMKLPFSIEQFLKVFEDYNLSVWPMQLVIYVMALVALFLSIKKLRWSGKIISLILSFFWIWMGIVYHLMFFTTINKAAYVFGIAFILQGILFFYYGFIHKRLSFRFSRNVYGVTGSFLMLFALLIYPITGYYMGHIYPASPTFGLPCPTTIFTFGLLLWASHKLPWPILIVPLLWSIIGSSAAFSLGITEDIGLLISAVLFVILEVMKSKKLPV
jgi:hypothetical protein